MARFLILMATAGLFISCSQGLNETYNFQNSSGIDITKEQKDNYVTATALVQSIFEGKALGWEKHPLFGYAKDHPESKFKIQLSLDSEKQKLALESLKNDEKHTTKSLVSLNPNTGLVEAYASINESRVSKESMEGYKMGSMVYPFIYGAGFAHQAIDPCFYFEDKDYCVQLEDKQFCYSENAPTYQQILVSDGIKNRKRNIAGAIQQRMSFESTARYAYEVGLTIKNEPLAALAAGGLNSTLIKMVSAYAPLVNNGVGGLPILFTTVEDETGKVIFDIQENPTLKTVMTPSTAYALLQTKNHPITNSFYTQQMKHHAWNIQLSKEQVIGVYIGVKVPKKQMMNGRKATEAVTNKFCELSKDEFSKKISAPDSYMYPLECPEREMIVNDTELTDNF